MKRAPMLVTLAGTVSLLAAGCGSSSKPPSASKPSAFSAHGAGAGRGPNTIQITLTSTHARPAVTTAKIDEVIAWTNASPIKRSIVATGAAIFHTNSLARGGTYTFRPTTLGTIYYTTTHPGLSGTISVTR